MYTYKEERQVKKNTKYSISLPLSSRGGSVVVTTPPPAPAALPLLDRAVPQRAAVEPAAAALPPATQAHVLLSTRDERNSSRLTFPFSRPPLPLSLFLSLLCRDRKPGVFSALWSPLPLRTPPAYVPCERTREREGGGSELDGFVSLYLSPSLPLALPLSLSLSLVHTRALTRCIALDPSFLLSFGLVRRSSRERREGSGDCGNVVGVSISFPQPSVSFSRSSFPLLPYESATHTSAHTYTHTYAFALTLLPLARPDSPPLPGWPHLLAFPLFLPGLGYSASNSPFSLPRPHRGCSSHVHSHLFLLPPAVFL